ncbi:MAG: phospholipid carrier-dependent glycosyltransferase [Candidatus Moranbacteria bacterium]|nr:phospholipid carrier-dependent glycosyltransferase [Candidatus Moranbacteria bacterium]
MLFRRNKKSKKEEPVSDAAVSSEKQSAIEEVPKKSVWMKFVWVLLAAPMLLYLNFALIHLTKFETADESLWYSQGRIQKYWKAIDERNWKNTRINDKPGVTLAIISGLARYWEKEAPPEVEERNRKFQYFPTERIEEAHFNYRIPIVVFNGIMALYFFWIIRRLTKNEWAALFSSTLILLNPILLGISQIINPDSLFWTFSLALLLTFLAFLETGGVIVAILSILLMGFTLASKYVGVIFFPFLILALFAHAMYRIPEWVEKSEKVWKKVLWRALIYPATVWGGIGVFALLMPAAIIKTKYLTSGTYKSHGMYGIFKICMLIDAVIILDALFFKSRIMIFIAKYIKYLRITIVKLLFFFMAGVVVLVGVDWMMKLDLFHVFDMPFEGGKLSAFKALPAYKQFLLEARPFVFSQTPLVILTLVLFWLVSIFKKWKSEWIVAVMTVFVPIFFLATMEQGLLIHVRYSIVLFPIASVIAGIALAEFFDWGFLKIVPKMLVFVMLVALGSSYLLRIQPFYFNYTSRFLPKEYSIVDGWGYGGYEAAQFLNSFPNVSTARVLADYDGVCQFYKGPCIGYSDKLRPSMRSRWNAGKYDYAVISAKGSDRFGFSDSFPGFQNQRSVWEMEIDNRPNNFLRIISSKNYKIPDAPQPDEPVISNDDSIEDENSVDDSDSGTSDEESVPDVESD